MAHVAEYKKNIVNDIVKLVKEYPIIGAVNMENLPAPQLQNMRSQLRDKVILTMTKRRLMKIALEKAKNDKKGIEKLEEHLKGMPALIFTKESPFKLGKILRKNKSKAPAKAGQIAPNDIMINKGSTGFAPGPIIGELGMIGIKAGVEDGKVAVKEDTVVVKEGEEIKPKVAEILMRLDIKPMEVGLDLMAAYEDGMLYTKEVLSIDDQVYMDNINKAASGAFNLAFNITYTTKDNIPFFISKAFNDAKSLGISQNIIDDGILDSLLAKAEGSMLSLKDSLNIEVSEKSTKEKDEKVVEEEVKKDEQKKEETKKQVEEKPDVKKEEPVKEETKTEEIVKEPVEEKTEIKKEEEVVPKQEIKKEEPKIEVKKEVSKEKPTTEKKVDDLVKKTKDFVEGKEVTADNLLKEAESEVKEEKKEDKVKEEKKEEVPSAHDLKKKKEVDDQKDVEELAKELVKKGTLRK